MLFADIPFSKAEDKLDTELNSEPGIDEVLVYTVSELSISLVKSLFGVNKSFCCINVSLF